jgi:hypothetical protein
MRLSGTVWLQVIGHCLDVVRRAARRLTRHITPGLPDRDVSWRGNNGSKIYCVMTDHPTGRNLAPLSPEFVVNMAIWAILSTLMRAVLKGSISENPF